MRSLPTFVLALWAAFFLVGCGQVPPQAIDDVLGLSGVEVPVTLEPTSGAGKVVTSAASSNPMSIAISPTRYTFVISLAESAALRGIAAPPKSFTLVSLNLSLSITNGQNTVTLPTMIVNGPIDLVENQGQYNSHSG